MTGRKMTESSDVQIEAALLVRWEGNTVAQEWRLDRPETVIGRAGGCDVCLDTRWVSRVHARITRDEGGYWLEDAGSKNGVFVNGQRVVDRHLFSDGDRMQLAPGLELTFMDSAATLPLPSGGRPQIVLDAERRLVLVDGQALVPPLSTTQFDFLATVAEEPGRVYSREELVAAVWPGVAAEGVSDDAIDALVRAVAAAIGGDCPGTRVFGYRARIWFPVGFVEDDGKHVVANGVGRGGGRGR